MTVRNQNHQQYMDLIHEFTEAFLDEASHRSDREGILPSGEFAWMVHEREFMRDLVNIARAERGLTPIGIGPITEVEQSASGHSDYAHKFAMYCADLVFDN